MPTRVVMLGLACGLAFPSYALDVPQVPLVTNASSQTPLNLLVLGKDHKLFYEAYDDASDLDGDGLVDTRYKPDTIDYYGYFDSKKCYQHSNGRFNPVSQTSNKQCNNGSSDQWSGDFLNYLTTARIDALRRVLYGGSRYLDDAVSGSLPSGQVVLQRAYIPQDAHAWGKQYTSVAVDGYDLARYAPTSWLPSASQRTLFANVTIGTETDVPLLRAVKVPSSVNVWNWLSKERPVAGTTYNAGNGDVTIAPTDYTVRVRVCDTRFPEDNCKKYSDGSLRPSGLLQKYGDSSRMRFGLLTGSFDLPLDGGVLRKNIGDISDEISATSGQFLSANGIISTLNKLRVVGFNNNGWSYSCGWETSNNLSNISNCRNWGNPLAEMMYEALRYYAGLSKTSSFSTSTSIDSGMGLPVGVNWQNPYGLDSNSQPRNYWCAKPNITLISDAYTSYDTGLPGSPFGEEGRAALGSFNALSAGNALWSWEFGGSRNIAIGELSTATSNDLAPTVKTASSFATLRGQAPGEPTRQGGFGTSLLAYYARSNTLINPSSTNKPTDTSLLPKINTYAVSLSSPSLKISIPMGDRTVTIQPYAKSVGGSGIPSNGYYPTDQIVDYYVTQVANTVASNYDANVNGGRPYYKFSINFEDVEQGADHDMDAIAEYTVSVTDSGKIRVAVNSTYAAGGIDQHMGFIITGVNPVNNGRTDGLYLVVKDQSGSAVKYTLDYRDTTNSSCKASTSDLPLTCTLDFDVDTSASALTRLNDPLWYAAKYGGYADSSQANSPSTFRQVWDNDGDGVPDNYFLVVNPLKLEQQLAAAFDSIARRAGSLTSGSATSLKVMADSLYFESAFDSANWTGDLSAYKVNFNSGMVDTGTTATLQWSAASKLSSDKRNGSTDRVIIAGSNSGGIPFRATDLQTASVLSSLRDGTETTNTNATTRVDYLRGSSSKEGTDSGSYRPRTLTKLGDLLRSTPLYVGAPYYQVEQSTEYETFRKDKLTRTPMVYVGGNDGMLHGFQASNGEERFSFIPKVFLKSGEQSKLVKLVQQGYASSHQNFVNGQQTRAEAKVGSNWRTLLAGSLGDGGRELYLLDITQPSDISESSAANLVKWEFTNADDSDLGLTFGRPYIARLNDGNWYVLAPNGYYDKASFPTSDTAATRKAGLFILPVNKTAAWANVSGNATGSTYFKLMTSSVGENGLSELRPVDLDKDGKVDLIYAGDLRGNVWKFDLSGSSPSTWNVALSNQPLFTAKGPDGNIQPIVVAPAVAYNTERRPETRSVSKPGLMVYVGTGKFIEQCDKNAGDCGRNDLVRLRESATNSVYGIWDYGGSVCDRTELRQQTISQYTASGGTVYRTSSSNAVAFPAQDIVSSSCLVNGSARTMVTDGKLGGQQYPFSSYRLGWYQDLPVSGERVITDLTQTAKQLQYLTYVPEISVNSCATQSAEGYLMAVNAQTGGAFNDTSIVITDPVGDANLAKQSSTVGLKVNAAFGYNLFDAPRSGSYYTMQDKPYQPFLVNTNSEGCANNVKTSAGQTVRLNAGASCNRVVTRVSWREVIAD